MATKAIVVNRKNNTVTVVSDAETLPLKMQELRGEEASVAAIKQAPKLGISRAGIGNERVAHLHPETKEIIDDVRGFCGMPQNKGITPEPCRIFTLR